MKLLSRLNRKKKINEKSISRSVVFIERSDKVGKKANLFTKRGFFRRLQRNPQKKSEKLSITIFFVVSVIMIILFLFLFSDRSSFYISPLPKINNTNSSVNEVERMLSEELKRQNMEYASIDTSEGSIFYITLKEKQEVVVAGDKDISSQIASLQFIYNRLTMEGKEFKRLDLRFDKPVITLR